ncbi:metallo-beta-lactamase domain-containing protein 1 [Musca autumnalis]|uniref:metallo-beta-lactamase domain-containing protein 1 n=1 Tax=Musca autumnalis TaxID=221902 RepID=UPI003CF11032
MINKVHVLAEGYSKAIGNSNDMQANCSCTVVKTESGCNIIVDTMTAWDGQLIADGLQRIGLQPHDIHYVICTHGHSDHIGCNYLFTSAKWHFVGSCMSHGDTYPEYDFAKPYTLENGNVVIMRTPGHTLTCVSVVVYNADPQFGGTVGICGDLFEREEDVFDQEIWLGAGSENPSLQRENRCKIADICSYIIPGHGKGFHVTDGMRAKLRSDMNEKLE